MSRYSGHVVLIITAITRGVEDTHHEWFLKLHAHKISYTVQISTPSIGHNVILNNDAESLLETLHLRIIEARHLRIRK